MTFEAVLYEGSNNIKFMYSSMGTCGTYCNGGSATVGIENSSETIGLLWSYNSSGSVYNGLSLLFIAGVPPTPTPVPPWVETDSWGVYQGTNPEAGCAYSWFEPPSASDWINTGINSSYYLAQNIPIGFPFQFYGEYHATVNISTEGFLTFDTKNYTTNYSIPDSYYLRPDDAIYAYWDNLYVYASYGSSIKYVTTGSPGSRIFAVKYDNVRSAYSSSTFFTFQVLFYEGSNNIKIQYQNIETGTYGFGYSATIGIENADGTVGIQYSYNGQRPVYNGLAVCFTVVGAPPTPTPTPPPTPLPKPITMTVHDSTTRPWFEGTNQG
jgi:hypothetical protein